MRGKYLAILAVVLFVAIAPFASATQNYYVDATSGSDTTGDGTQSNPWKTITYSLTQIAGCQLDPCILHIAAGLYDYSNNGETFPLQMQSWLSLKGEASETTIINAENQGSALVLDGIEHMSISGLTIRGGYAGQGGGIYMIGSDNINIFDCTITYNFALNEGGGIYSASSDFTVTGSTISHNDTDGDGGAFYGDDTTATFEDNQFGPGNHSQRCGGACFCYAGVLTFSDNKFTENTADDNGGAMLIETSDAELRGNDFEDNTSAVSGGAICCRTGGSPTIADSEMTGNTADEWGGAILVYDGATASLSDVRISGSTADRGGAIACDDSGTAVNLQRCNLFDNETNDVNYAYGGGIYCNDYASITVSASTISSCIASWRGGAVYAESHCEVVVTASTISSCQAGYYGGGLGFANYCTISIGNNRITGNRTNHASYPSGGGIYLYGNVDGTIIGNYIYSNRGTGSGGGIGCVSSDPVIKDNAIVANRGTLYGGGMAFYDYHCQPTIANNLVVQNTAGSFGGGMLIADSARVGDILQCTFASNSPDGIYLLSGTATVTNCILWDNGDDLVGFTTGVTYSDIDNDDEGFAGSNGNISEDPLFVDTTGCGDYGDWYLSQPPFQPDTSPCIDSGNTSVGSAYFATYPYTTCTNSNLDGGSDVDMGFHYLKGCPWTEYFVNATTGDDSYNGLAPEWDGANGPFKRITKALTVAVDKGDTIHVAEGLYDVTNNDEEFPLEMNDGVSLLGNGTSSTIIDAEASEGTPATVMEILGASDLIVTGFTIMNGWSDSQAGAIYCYDSSPTIASCLIKDSTGLIGGGIGSEHGSPAIIGCTLIDNVGSIGGAIYCSYGSPVITGCTIKSNHANEDGQGGGGAGGAIALYRCETGLIKGNTILGNEAENEGGGIYLEVSSPTVATNRLDRLEKSDPDSGNKANKGGGIYIAGTPDDPSCPAICDWNLVHHNIAEQDGGGIYIEEGCQPRIIENEIYVNKAINGYGGGIYSCKASPTIKANYITHNSAYSKGGGLYCEDSSASAHIIDDINWIIDNDCHGSQGGGIYFLNASDRSLICNNSIQRNKADQGAGVFLDNPVGIELSDNAIKYNEDSEGLYISSGDATLFNNLIVSRPTKQQTGVLITGEGTVEITGCTVSGHSVAGLDISGGSGRVVNVLNSIIWGNAESIVVSGSEAVTVEFSDIEGGWSGSGNIDEDPLFISGYFLKQDPPQDEDSPCKDAGSGAASDYYSDQYSTRTDAVPDAGTVDMGFHYRLQSATYIRLVSFDARAEFNSVVISWTTGSEIDTAGFHIFRRNETTGRTVRVTKALIEAKGGPSIGASYRFVDTAVPSGLYLYYLVEVETTGNVNLYGPIRVRVENTPILRLPMLQEQRPDLSPARPYL